MFLQRGQNSGDSTTTGERRKGGTSSGGGAISKHCRCKIFTLLYSVTSLPFSISLLLKRNEMSLASTIKVVDLDPIQCLATFTIIVTNSI